MNLNKGSAAATSPTQGVDPWGGMRQVTTPNMFDRMKAFSGDMQARQDAMTPEQKQRQEMFAGMMQPQEAQFSPVQFGGSAQGGALAQYIAQLLNKPGA